MIKPTDRTHIKPFPPQRQRTPGQKTPVWWWLILAGGSIAIHAGLAAVVLPIAVPSASSAASSYTPIDLVNLPKTASASDATPSATVKPAVSPASSGATSATSSPLAATAPPDDQAMDDQAIVWTSPRATPVPSPQPVSSPSAKPAKAPPSATQPPPFHPSVPSASPAARSEVDTSTPPTRPSPQTLPAVPRVTPSPTASPLVGTPIPDPVTPLPSPEVKQSPAGLASERIQVPIPDVTASIVPPPTTVPSPSPIAVSANIAPIRLTANLSVALLPDIDRRDRPDVLATPKAPNQPPHPECLRLVTAEAEQFFGRTVAMQVATDVTGQVTDTRVQRSSDSREYDALAQCIVKRWAFVPAQKHHHPVPSTAQLISITIGRG